MLNMKHSGHVGTAMIDDAPPSATDPAVKVNSTIPAVYTYWGQFIDHDMTSNTDRTYDEHHRPDPGPEDKGFHGGIRCPVGENATGDRIPALLIAPEDDLSRDLPHPQRDQNAQVSTR